MGVFLKTPLLHQVRELQKLLVGPGGSKDQGVLGVLTSRWADLAFHTPHHTRSGLQCGCMVAAPPVLPCVSGNSAMLWRSLRTHQEGRDLSLE